MLVSDSVIVSITITKKIFYSWQSTFSFFLHCSSLYDRTKQTLISQNVLTAAALPKAQIPDKKVRVHNHIWS